MTSKAAKGATTIAISGETKAVEVTITVTRKGVAKTYQLTEVGASKKGTYLVFGSPGNADLPPFFKGYINLERSK